MKDLECVAELVEDVLNELKGNISHRHLVCSCKKRPVMQGLGVTVKERGHYVIGTLFISYRHDHHFPSRIPASSTHFLALGIRVGRQRRCIVFERW